MFARVLAWAKDRGRILKNPLEKPGRVYDGSRAEIIWTDEDERAFLAHCSEQLGLAFMLAIWTGQRMGDLLRLQWTAYDGENIRMRQSKTGARVKIPVAAALRDTLDRAPRRNMTILTNRSGEKWTEHGFRSSWRKAAIRAGVDGPGPGDLRGTAVVRLAQANCTAPEIGSITGHTNAEINEILDKHYLAKDPRIAKNAITKLESRTPVPK